MTSLPLSIRGDEVEWSSEPLPEESHVGLLLSRRPQDIPQVNGATDIEGKQAYKELTHEERKK